ncbi:MAG TPA: hypothetical protein DCL08_07835 [Anaerolineaceae bacterium]|nr:hypothetical protein [Anaerolineaceae bacterium]
MGYPLDLLGKFGLFVEGGVRFHINLGWPISSLDEHSTGIAHIAPGQTAKVGYIIEDEVDYTKNWKNPFPFNYDQWEKPFCVIIQELWCESENIRTTFDVNIVACQDN